MKPRYFKVVMGPIRGMYIYQSFRHGIKKILGWYEPEVTKIVINLSKGTEVCIDVGCHVGYISLAMLKGMGLDGKLICIDPIQEDIELVNKTLQKNKASDFTTLAIGLGDENKKMTAGVYTDSGMARFSDSKFTNEVTPHISSTFEIKTLDTACQELNITNVDFIKIDVEGYEYKVLKGAENLLKTSKPKLLIELHGKPTGEEVVSYLEKLNYSITDLQNNKIKSGDVKEGVSHILAK
ncbi:MAG: FkbM family methyltransferase [Candidatus Paceibacterota bacterium]